METVTSDRTTWRSSSSSSAARSRAVRNLSPASRLSGFRLVAALLCGPLAGLAVTLPAGAAEPAPPPCTPLSLAPRLAAPATGDVFLRGGTASCDSIELEVAVHGLAGVFTVAFDLGYPTGTLHYEGYAEGALLLRGPPRQAPLFLVREPAAGNLQVTMTRFAPDAAVAVATGATEGLVRLRFKRVKAGTAEIDFLSGASSAVAERIVDAQGAVVPARFSPGHGATVTVP
jgi:hypothetical protein